MAYKRPYKPYTFDQSDRKTLTITNFGGVDLTSQKFNVSSSRAIQSLNFVYRDGMIQKRFGYEQVYQFKAQENDTTNFNGIWKFIGEDKKEHIVAHIGKKLYEVLNLGKEFVDFKMLNLRGVSGEVYNLLDKKSNAFVSGNKLWILGGIDYLCVRFIDEVNKYVIKVVDMDECFVPTTTMSIVESYADLSSDIRISYQPVNMLTKWRKNACITGTIRNKELTSVSKFYKYQLDAPIVWENESDMSNFSITIETVGD